VSSALLVVDLQPDFMPGGALPVAGGDRVIPGINALLGHRDWNVVVATQDWHPPGHVSFASSHPGREPFATIDLHGHRQTLWPDHCVQGSPGAALHPDFASDRCDAIVRKGADEHVDSYSAFRNNWDSGGERPATGLAGYLHERRVDEVVVCGLARDFCVLWSAEDAAAAGFRVRVVWDLTRPVDPEADDTVRRALARRGVTIVDSTEV
jgi:nicotinamidase/pyrazinamidase